MNPRDPHSLPARRVSPGAAGGEYHYDDGPMDRAVMRLVDRYRLGGIATIYYPDATVLRPMCDVRGLARLIANHPEADIILSTKGWTVTLEILGRRVTFRGARS